MQMQQSSAHECAPVTASEPTRIFVRGDFARVLKAENVALVGVRAEVTDIIEGYVELQLEGPSRRRLFRPEQLQWVRP